MFTRTNLLKSLQASGLEYSISDDIVTVEDSDKGVNQFGPIIFDAYHYCRVEMAFRGEDLVQIHFTAYP